MCHAKTMEDAGRKYFLLAILLLVGAVFVQHMQNEGSWQGQTGRFATVGDSIDQCDMASFQFTNKRSGCGGSR